MNAFRPAALALLVLLAASAPPIARAGEAEDRQKEIERISQALVKLAEEVYRLEQERPVAGAGGGAASNQEKIAAKEKEREELELKQNVLYYQQTKAKYIADLAAGGAPSDVSPALNEVLRQEKQLAAAKEALRKVEADPTFTITPEQKQKNAGLMADREKRIQMLEQKAQYEVIHYITLQALHGRFPESNQPDSEFSKKLAAKVAEPENKAKLAANPKYLLYLARQVVDE